MSGDGSSRRRSCSRSLLSLLVLLILLGTVISEAWPVFSERGLGVLERHMSSDFATEPACGRDHRIAGPDLLRGRDRRAARDRRRGLPAGVRARHSGQPDPDHQHPEPGRRAVDRLRHPRGRRLRRDVAKRHRTRVVTGRSFISGGLTLAVLVMPFMIIITMEALAGGAARHPGGGLRRGGHALGGRAQPRAAVRGARRLHRLGPRAGSSLRRDCPAAAGGSGDRLSDPAGSGTSIETLQGKYTALPTIIFSWARKPGEEWQATRPRPPSWSCSSSILVVNLAAILLRNRYERKW